MRSGAAGRTAVAAEPGRGRYARPVATPAYISDIRRTYGQGRLLLPGVSAVVLDPEVASEGQRVLLVRRSDDGRWTLPSGIVEPDEQPADSITREVLEETRVRVRPERLALLTTEPEITYPNGDRCQFISMTFRATYLGGVAEVGDDESTEVGWFPLGALPELSAAVLRRIDCSLALTGATVFDGYGGRRGTGPLDHERG